MMEEILKEKTRLEQLLFQALSTMEKKDTINEIHAAILRNQARCPHADENYDYSIEYEICPYCGKRI